MREPPDTALRLLVDNSAYARARRPPATAAWIELLTARRLVACDPFLMEALCSARSGDDLRDTRTDLVEAMPRVRCDEQAWDLAFAAQERMADAAGLLHRRKPVDYLVAAIAHQHRLGVLHYDRDYDLLAKHSGLRFESVWIAPAGSLER